MIDADKSKHPASDTWLYLILGLFLLWYKLFFFYFFQIIQISFAAYIVGKNLKKITSIYKFQIKILKSWGR